MKTKNGPIDVRWVVIIAALVLLLLPHFLMDKASGEENFGETLSPWYCIPFVGMLLSIALFPLFKPHFWERHMSTVTILWSLCFLIPFALLQGAHAAGSQFYEIMLLDYLPFIVLLWGLFAVSGGIVLKGSLSGSPKANLILLVIGTLLASWIGTAGASVLLIRPLLRANAWREKKAHTVVFFIFLVSNIGGVLTPVGDPPLFLGFLHGVPFFQTLHLAPLLLFNAAVLLVVFFLIDRRAYKKEIAAGRKPPGAAKGPLRVEGLHNLVFLAMIVGAVILSGILGSLESWRDPSTGAPIAAPIPGDSGLPVNVIVQMLIILAAGFLSLKTTRKKAREPNRFTWGPIKEVAVLFAGIFVTMIPALAILHARGAGLGLTEPWQFFWATGALSSFLDNAPTYLAFLSTAASLGTSGITTTLGTIAPPLLAAVSAGAVFMGANTYIGNAPNFMVRCIAEEDGVKMPSFFGYMGWAGAILIPLFVLDTIFFFIIGV
ncbi:MAG: sodium:proton antiporter [Clostridiales bacterium]|nr:sodium:proton antiporter [Clostridiales bacterium]